MCPSLCFLWWDRNCHLRFGNMVKTQCALRGGDEWPMRKTLFRISLHQTKTVKKPRKTAGWARAGAAAVLASGAARRRKRSLKEAADLYLSLPVEDKRRWNKLARRYLDAEEIDNQMAMIVALWDGAMSGDARSAKVLIDLIGTEGEEQQGETLEITGLPEEYKR